MKKLLCTLLALSMLVSVCAFFAYAEAPEWDSECKTHCGGRCGTSPIIVVPGIMQSQVYVQDENGNDLLTSAGFPIVEGMDMQFMFDMEKLMQDLKASLFDMVKAVLRSDRDALLDIVAQILDENFAAHYFNSDGTRVNDVEVDEYWYSFEESAKRPEKSYNYARGYSKDENGNPLPTTKYVTELDFIARQVDLSGFTDKYGLDHAYYFAYSSFGDTLSIAERLNEYIDMVKAQTGHDKVSIVFISLGGTIGNVYLSEYCDRSEIDRIVFAAAAMDGSYLLSDLMKCDTSLDDGNVLYNELVGNLLSFASEEYSAFAGFGNAVLRGVPKKLFSDFLNEALERAIGACLGKLLRNCPSMWALVPSAEYTRLSNELISDEEHSVLKEKTDKYYSIQKNAANTLQRLEAQGTEMFVICGYDLELPGLIQNYYLSSDNIIQAASTSIGGTFARAGETLPEDYAPSVDASYISPDGAVDAGTCALAERTWFIKGQSHLSLQSSVNDVIGMCIELATNKSITDARNHNGGYPQFNEYRNLKLTENLMSIYNQQDETEASLDAAYERAVSLLASKTWSAQETAQVEQALYREMYSAGLLPDDLPSPFVKYTLMPAVEKIGWIVSRVLNGIFGSNSYWFAFEK